MAQSAVWNEGRRYPRRGKSGRERIRQTAHVEGLLQDVLLSVPVESVRWNRSFLFLLLVVGLIHGLVISQMQKRAKWHESATTVPVPIDVVIPVPMPVQPQVSKPAPMPVSRSEPRPVRNRPAELPDKPTTESPAETPQAETAPAPPSPTAVPVGNPASNVVPVVPSATEETQAAGRMGYLSNPSPMYPDSALDRGLEGTVALRVRVLATGEAASVEIQTSSGYRVLDDAAVRTVRRWKFVPATRGGTAVDGWANVPIVFKIGK